MREVVVKVTQLLAGMGLKVTQRGTQAKVLTDRVTHKPFSVNIPYLPDNASKELILAIQGFIDHEVAHILETDFSVHGRIDIEEKKGRPHLRIMWNALEDTFIERAMSKRFSGSGYNLEQLHKFFIAEITKPALDKAVAAGDWNSAFAILLVPAFRAWAGQRPFIEFFKETGYFEHPELANAWNRLKPFEPRLPKLASTADCYDLAIEIDDALKAPKKAAPPPPPPPPAPPEPPEEEPENEPSGANGGEGETPEDEGKGAGNEDAEPEDKEGEDDEPSAGDEAGDESALGDEQEEDADDADAEGDEAGGEPAAEDDEPGEGASGDDEEGEPEDSGEPGDGASAAGDEADADPNADGEDAGAGAPEGDGDDQEGDQADDESGEVGAAGADDDDGEDEPGEGDREADEPGDDADGESAGGSESDEGEGSDGEAGAPGAADGADADEAEEAPLSTPNDEEVEGAHGNEDPDQGGPVVLVTCRESDFEEALAAQIGKEAKEAALASPYRIYTTDFDVVEPFPTDMRVYRDAWLTELDDRTRQSVGVMQRDIERMMQARSQVQKVPGFRTGRLHQAGLHRLVAGDDRVFRRLHENKSKDVAVGLLIDNSGSMDGSKMRTAMQSGYALSSTLERVAIKHEVLGFTTKWNPYGPEIREAQEAARKEGVPFTRYEPLYMPIYKGFDERMTSEVKRRFAAAPFQDFLANNVDGECVERAAWRLLQRPEKRKVLLVLSDGNPAADGDMRALRAHLKLTVDAVEKKGIETIGIGIEDDAPRHYYKKFVLLEDAASLPKAVMGELRKILLA
nr:hypothetical protein [Methylorubrum extorquens]